MMDCIPGIFQRPVMDRGERGVSEAGKGRGWACII